MQLNQPQTSEEENDLVDQAVEKCKELIRDGQEELAREVANQILRCVPDHVEANELLGLCHHQRREYQQAIPFLRKAVEENPDNADFLNNLALPLSVIGQEEEAIECLERACKLAPHDYRIINNLALQYRYRDPDRALAILDESLAQGMDSNTLANKAGMLGEYHRLEESEKCFRQAIEVDQNNAMAHCDLAHCLHLQGRYEEAWREYEWRLQCLSQLQVYNKKYDPARRWTGDSLDGKTIALYCEQGIGDSIMFARFFPELKRRWECRITVHCNPELQSLFHHSELGIDGYFTTSIMEAENIPAHDVHCPTMSLPLMLGMTQPRGGAFFKAPVADVGYPNAFKVGVCWCGSPQHAKDSLRSCYLREFKEIHDIPAVKLYSLCKYIYPRKYTYSDDVVNYAEGVEDMRLVDCREYMTDFLHTAAIIKGLDLVITVDTAVMHLSAGLGVPTWGMIAYNPDWRWGLEGTTSPYYDSLTLFRQEKRGDWSGVLKEMRDRLYLKVNLENALHLPN